MLGSEFVINLNIINQYNRIMSNEFDGLVLISIYRIIFNQLSGLIQTIHIQKSCDSLIFNFRMYLHMFKRFATLNRTVFFSFSLFSRLSCSFRTPYAGIFFNHCPILDWYCVLYTLIWMHENRNTNLYVFICASQICCIFANIYFRCDFCQYNIEVIGFLFSFIPIFIFIFENKIFSMELESNWIDPLRLIQSNVMINIIIANYNEWDRNMVISTQNWFNRLYCKSLE